MKKLYMVEATIMVMAENEQDAVAAASSIDVDLHACDVDVAEAFFVSEAWEKGIPFNADDDKTCGEILAERKASHDPTHG